MRKTNELICGMISYYAGDPKRVQHFLKVYAFAKAIGESELLEDSVQELLECAAITHDIGIKLSEEKYHSNAGKYQELEGPAVAKELLTSLNYESDFIKKVCYLIAHHHTYNNIDSIAYQILVEADFLVNIYEGSMPVDLIQKIKDNIFKTKTGLSYLCSLYGV